MPDSSPALTRRGVLAAGGAAILGAAGGFALGTARADGAGSASTPVPTPATEATASPTATPAPSGGSPTIPFYGTHQAGVETEPALLQTFVGLNLREPSRDSLEAVLRLVTDDAARLTGGEPALGDTEPELAAYPDRLTVTVGLGRPLFERVGLEDRIPAQSPAQRRWSNEQVFRAPAYHRLFRGRERDRPRAAASTTQGERPDTNCRNRRRGDWLGLRRDACAHHSRDRPGQVCTPGAYARAGAASASCAVSAPWMTTRASTS